VAKVKKRAALTGVRNVKDAKAKRRTSANRPLGKAEQRGTQAGARTRPTKQVRMEAPKARSRGTSAPHATRGLKPAVRRESVKKGRAVTPLPQVRVTVRALDPQRKCGAGTSVQLLYRVDETVDGRASAHLVFFDRHGWYCEHGRTCPAVAHARKQSGQFARVS
jgi:hypothetical protein